MDVLLYPRIDPNDVQKLFDITDSLVPRAVGMQILIMTSLSIMTIITFNVLRPNNKVVYEPKTKYHAPDKPPPHISDTFCGWIPPLIHNHERDLFDKIGLDAVAFLRFLHLLRWLFTLTALTTCGGLVPLDFLYTISIDPSHYDFLSAMTIRDVRGVRLFAHIGSTYLITFFLVVLVHHHWYAMFRLRNRWFRSPEYQNLFYARTLCITNIPERHRSDLGLRKIFTGMQLPYPVTSVHIGRSVGHLPELIKRHNDTVEELENLVLKHMDGGELEAPTIRVGGCCGIGGRSVDAIMFYTAKLKHTEAAVQQYSAQLNMRKSENYGFASISSIPFAHAAARELKGQHPKGLTIKLAPNPKDIIWKNLGLSKPMRRFRRTIGFALLLLFCFLSLVPLFPIASLANLDALAAFGYIPFLLRWSTSSPTTYTLASGVVPPAVAAVFNYFLPRLMRWLSKFMGANTFSDLDRVVIARYFTFLVVSQLIIFTVIGVLFHSVLEIVTAVRAEASVKTVLNNLDKLPARITRTYVDQASFWLKWFPMRGFLVIFDLAQIFNLINISLKNRIFGRTPRDIREGTKPPVFEYSFYYSNLLFMAAVGLLFAPLAPLVSLAAAIVFWIASWVYKYQLMFVYITRLETGGALWNVVINRLLFSAMFMQIILISTIGLQSEFKSLQFLATIPPLFFLLLFKHYINKRFANDFQYYVPIFNELSRSVVHSEGADISANKLEERYRNPALQADLFTPMVHSRMMPLLRRIYKRKSRARRKGDLTRTMEMKSGFKDAEPEEDIVEGVTFTPVNETELEYDPELYMRDREAVDCDVDSVNSRSSSDSLSSAPPPQLAFEHERLRHNGNFVNASYRGPGYEPETFGQPPPLAGGPPYAGAVWSPPIRKLQRHPSPLSPAASYQLADNHTGPWETAHFRSPTTQALGTPGSYPITESKRQSRDRNPGTRGGPRSRGVVEPSSSGHIITSKHHP